METTTRTELQERQDTSLISGSEAELLNAMTSDESDKEDAKPMFCSHLRNGCNFWNESSIEARLSCLNRIFVLSKSGKPLLLGNEVKIAIG